MALSLIHILGRPAVFLVPQKGDSLRIAPDIRLDQLHRPVRGAVVLYKEFPVGIGLIQNGLYLRDHILFPIIDGHEYIDHNPQIILFSALISDG